MATVGKEGERMVERQGTVEVEGFLGMEFTLRIPKGLLEYPEEADDLVDQLRVGLKAPLHWLRSRKLPHDGMGEY